MAWVSYERINEGVTVTGKFGESYRATERYTIRVDTPTSNKKEVLDGVTTNAGIYWGMPHPEWGDLKLMEFELSPTARDGMRWLLTLQFYVPEPKKTPKDGTDRPEDQWERTGGVVSVPAFTDVDGETIVNAAFDPLEGLERERDEKTWTLTKYYETDAELADDITEYSGKLNEAAWDGGDPETWKCYFKAAKRSNASRLADGENATTAKYIEAQWEFRYDPLTWKLMPWDVGFMEWKNGKKTAIVTSDGKPVKQPVALNSDGSAKPAGQKPVVIKNGDGVEVYELANFTVGFGEPHILPTDGENGPLFQ